MCEVDGVVAHRPFARAWAGEQVAAMARQGLQFAQHAQRDAHLRVAVARARAAQGRRDIVAKPAALTHTMRASRAGRISEIDGWRIAGMTDSSALLRWVDVLLLQGNVVRWHFISASVLTALVAWTAVRRHGEPPRSAR